MGKIKNITTNKILKPYLNGRKHSICLQGKVKSKTFVVDRLVMKYFKKVTKKKISAMHINKNMLDDSVPNLKPLKRGDLLRSYRKAKGVYKHKDKYGTIRYRAMLTINYKQKTLGYFKTKKEAYLCWKTFYNQMFGHLMHK